MNVGSGSISFFDDNSGAAPFVLTDGSGTTANSTAVDLGGPLTSNAFIDSSGRNFIVSGQTGANIVSLVVDNGDNILYVTAADSVTNSTVSLDHTGISLGVDNLTLNEGVGFFLSPTVYSFPTGGISIGDAINSMGVYYQGDYEANFVPRSLVTKTYVDSKALTNGSGTTANGTAVDLGGDTTGDTTISFGSNNFTIIGTDTRSGNDSGIAFDSVSPGFDLAANATGLSFEIKADSTQLFLQALDNSTSHDQTVFLIPNTSPTGGMVISDGINSAGFRNLGDYEPNFVARSLVTKQYVDANRNAVNFGQTASNADIGHFAIPAGADRTIRVGAWVDLLSTAGSTLVIRVSWSNAASITVIKNFFPQGATTSVMSLVDSYAMPTMDFRAQNGTTVTVSTVVTGVGAILYNAGCTISTLQGA